ncbi:MAG: IS1380 family transposase [Deltaproteobacteria bacterium]|nr:MAG: IS1380 family transposase [Deltaproteobacteria bacterium]
MKRLILEQSSDEFYTSHSGLALAGACINRYSDLGQSVGRVAKGSDHIAEIDILRSYLGLLCLGKSDYQAIAAMREDDYFKQALGIGRMPSVERLRQRLDEAGTALVPVINRCTRTMLKRLKVPITGYRNGLIPLDVDVFPQDNSNTKKEGVSRTYKNYDGYAPMAAYLGMEGWCLEVELRPGSQHSQKGFIDFIKRVVAGARDLTNQPLLVRADSGNDAFETLVALEDAENTHYIVKWNPRKSDTVAWRDKVFAEGPVKTPREGKRVGTIVVEERKKVEEITYILKRIVRVTERTIDKHGQFLLAPDITLEGWWTDLAMEPEDVIELYRQHATSEQFHSEFKTDLDLERLPSGKFATNALIMALGGFAYNILRFIGQTGLIAPFGPVRHSAKRRRLRTVIQELMYLAARLITTGRQLKLRFSRHCPAFAAFSAVYSGLMTAN